MVQISFCKDIIPLYLPSNDKTFGHVTQLT